MSERGDAIADRGFRWLVTGAGILVLVALAAAMLSMLDGGRDAFARFGLGFFWSDTWDPVGQEFGALVPIYGTVVTALIAMLIAVPVSFGIAMFLTEVAPKWMRGTVGAAWEVRARSACRFCAIDAGARDDRYPRVGQSRRRALPGGGS